MPEDICDKVWAINPNKYLLFGRAGWPVRSNVEEVDGHFRRIRKWIPGLISGQRPPYGSPESHRQYKERVLKQGRDALFPPPEDEDGEV
jgi:hypothetical protein